MPTDGRALMGADFSNASASGAMDPSLDDLAQMPICVAWQREPAKKPGAPPRKMPYPASSSARRGSATDPKTWGPRQAATARAAALPKPCGIGGVGIVLTALDGGTALCGLDLDSCRDPRGGNLAPWAAKVVRRFGSYTEVSPSETGVILMRAEDREAILGGIRAAKGDPEVEGDKWAYGTGEGHPPAMQLFLGKRFFIVTGNTLVPQELRVVEAEEVRWRPLCCPVPAQKERCR